MQLLHDGLQNHGNGSSDRIPRRMFPEEVCPPLILSTFGKVPENAFLKYKKRHLTKVAISKHLDAHPGTSLLLFRWRLWTRDNWSSKKDHTAN